MAFGDNSAARARRAELIQQQADQTVTVQSSAETGALTYRVYPDLPPGIGWVLKQVGTIVPKWYLKTKEEAIAAVDRHAAVHRPRERTERINETEQPLEVVAP